jgi:chromosome segregation ATPase
MPLIQSSTNQAALPAEPDVFHPDPELSDQLAQLTERALTKVAVDGAVQSARARIDALEREVAQLRAEAQWREAGWEEERSELRGLVHSAQLETTEQRSRQEQAQLDVMELEDELRCVRKSLDETRLKLSALTASNAVQLEQFVSNESVTERLREQLLERERVLGAMWQTLQEYRAQGPIHRFLRPPGLPDSQATLLIDTSSDTRAS